MRAVILQSGILLTLTALGTSTATAQTELFFATGVDSTGRALAQSNADGHVLIESPQYPHGLWLHLVDEAGNELAGIQVEYQGRPDSLVAIHCVDPGGGVRETLIWTRADSTPLSLILKPKEATNLPAGLVSIDWQINPTAEALLELGNNRIADVTPLAGLASLRYLELSNNQIEDLAPLVANIGLSEGDRVYLSGNPLSDQARNKQIPALEARGVTIHLLTRPY